MPRPREGDGSQRLEKVKGAEGHAFLIHTFTS
jgi:hypothetical protein